MTTTALQILLDDLDDTREIVLRDARDDDPALAIWRAATADAHDAYTAWVVAPGVLTHAAYLAACDQEDAARATLAAAHAQATGVVPAEPHAPRPLAA